MSISVSERIIAILNSYEIKAGDFANIIGVTAATISNLKNGKSGMTSQIAQKIVNSYPELNFKWVLLGEGNMSKTIGFQSGNDYNPQKRLHTDELFPIGTDNDSEFSNLSELETKKINPQTNVSSREGNQQPTAENQSTKNKMESTSQVSKLDKPDEKFRSIEKIIIYYSDKTFEEYDMTKCKL